ncbi:enoyl-CoA hydratase [Marinobacter santoriniensis NKSG1]|uniref:Enoyl-CoA hydratase n=1 Tax=Marinobacter santoriniensis NKSG1 TaxID=1288826 RepID=M7D4E5_9GAMM|nr:enoyl-CoA hydratase-related protein [Marinobacter santoriniensis]EMP55613.1 enoyl-CoA hydratase [Marinobacter santoriniensis NKSG1]
MPASNVRTEIDGPVCTIILDRPEKKNAVDRATANALREAFEQFESDENLRVAVLWGDHGTFCSGADLTAMADPDARNEIDPRGDGPGPMARRQWDLPQAQALKEEGLEGYPVVFEEAIAGAGRFASGAGRHGRFED